MRKTTITTLSAVTLLLAALSVLPLDKMAVIAASASLLIINPGPDGYPTRWNASTTVRYLGTSNFIFYSNETAVNSTFFLNVTIQNVELLRGWGIGLIYDATILKYVSAWRPTDHVFKPVEDMGWTIVAPPVVVEPINETHSIIKWGYAYIMPESEVWTFNGTGTLCQIRFKIINEVNITNPQVTAYLTFDPDWTSVYYYPTGQEIPLFTPAYFEYSWEDTTPPTIETPTQSPPVNNVLENQPVTVSVSVTDAESGVKNVTLYYTNNTVWYAMPMEFNATTGLWKATIPGHALGTQVKYKIEAYDNAGNHAVNDNAGEYYVYTVVPEFSLTVIIILLMATTLIILMVSKIQKQKSKN
ncbi:MAG: hypothetical protein QXR45_06340 [Candidatus Bathyarchaeia archaeon]